MVDKDERGLFEAMLHRLQVIRQETEQQTAILRQLCQAMDSLGLEIGRMANALEPADTRGRKTAKTAQPGVAALSAQAALAKDLLARAQTPALNVSGKHAGK
jgi:hypothetical protein